MASASGGNRGKSRVTAAILAWLLGWCGAHHFYLGATMAGVTTIAVVWLTCFTGGILPFIEFIMLLMMSDEDFDAKYNQREPEPMEFVFSKK